MVAELGPIFGVLSRRQIGHALIKCNKQMLGLHLRRKSVSLWNAERDIYVLLISLRDVHSLVAELDLIVEHEPSLTGVTVLHLRKNEHEE